MCGCSARAREGGAVCSDDVGCRRATPRTRSWSSRPRCSIRPRSRISSRPRSLSCAGRRGARCGADHGAAAGTRERRRAAGATPEGLAGGELGRLLAASDRDARRAELSVARTHQSSVSRRLRSWRCWLQTHRAGSAMAHALARACGPGPAAPPAADRRAVSRRPPGEDAEGPYLRFVGEGSWWRLLAGMGPMLRRLTEHVRPQNGRPQRDSNPCFGLERATS